MIRRNGLVHPLMVHKQNDKWVIKEGGHRYYALKALGVKTAMCVDVTEFIGERWNTDI